MRLNIVSSTSPISISYLYDLMNHIRLNFKSADVTPTQNHYNQPLVLRITVYSKTSSLVHRVIISLIDNHIVSVKQNVNINMYLPLVNIINH